MTENEALLELKTFPINCLDYKEKQALDIAIKALEEIQQYRDAEEQGRLLPYKIGDKFYKPIDWKNCIDECKVSSLIIKSDGSLKIRLSGIFGVFEITTNDIGKTVFLTREEAEQALAKMKEV